MTRATARSYRSCRRSFPGPGTGPAGVGAGVFRAVIRGNLDPGRPDRVSLIAHGKTIVLRRRAGRTRIGPACPTEWWSGRGCSTPGDESVNNQEDE